LIKRRWAEALATDGRAFNEQLIGECGKEWQALKDSGRGDAESGLHQDHFVGKVWRYFILKSGEISGIPQIRHCPNR